MVVLFVKELLTLKIKIKQGIATFFNSLWLNQIAKGNAQ